MKREGKGRDERNPSRVGLHPQVRNPEEYPGLGPYSHSLRALFDKTY